MHFAIRRIETVYLNIFIIKARVYYSLKNFKIILQLIKSIKKWCLRIRCLKKIANFHIGYFSPQNLRSKADVPPLCNNQNMKISKNLL